MPELSCHTCDATWAAGLDNLIQSGYWPATIQFSTIYGTDVFYSLEEMKMAAPGLSCQAFLRMLDQRTFRFGHVSTKCMYPTVLIICWFCGFKRC